MEIDAQVSADSSAARSISSRRGAGRARHVEVPKLWVQEKVRRGNASIIKVQGEDNVADGLTKHVDRNKLEKYVKEWGFAFRDGRHDICLYLGDI